ncbi:MAG: sulfurtransferase-like selenium metabolism protein YedF [Dehalococcoidales bacterium]
MGELKGKVLLLSSEGCGTGDADLGFEILTTLLETLPEREDRPTAIICWNTAVRLLTDDSPLLARLKRLEEKGVSILAGQLCVRELELTGKIAVGKSATLGEILDLILHNDVISL